MSKKKKSKLSISFFKPSYLSTLAIGLVIGIASQRIPQARAYTDNVIEPIKHSFSYSPQYTQESPLPGQPISSFVIHCPGYSLAYDARNRNPAWVYEHLTAESIKDYVKRMDDFKEDESIPQHSTAFESQTSRL